MTVGVAGFGVAVAAGVGVFGADVVVGTAVVTGVGVWVGVFTAGGGNSGTWFGMNTGALISNESMM